MRLAAFAYPAYRLFWTGQLASNVGSWMQIVATGWLVLQLTDSPAFLGLNAAFQAAPLLLFALAGGLFADRFDRQRLMIVAQLATLLPDVLLAVLVATGQVQVWHIFAYSLVGSTIRGLSTPARQAFVPGLVPREALLSAIALNSILWQGAAVLGPAAAGLVLATWGLAGNFYLNLASDLVNLVALLLIRVPRLPRPAPRSPWREVAEGAVYAWREPRVRFLLLAVGSINLLGRSYIELMPVFARDVLAVGPTGLGLLLTMPAVGTILIALALAAVPHLQAKGRWLLVAAGSMALALGVFAVSSWFGLSLAALLVVGALGTATTTLSNTLLQQVVADRLRGRVMGFYMGATQGASSLGGLPAGLFAQVAGAPLAVLAGAAGVLAVVGALALRAPALRRLD